MAPSISLYWKLPMFSRMATTASALIPGRAVIANCRCYNPNTTTHTTITHDTSGANFLKSPQVSQECAADLQHRHPLLCLPLRLCLLCRRDAFCVPLLHRAVQQHHFLACRLHVRNSLQLALKCSCSQATAVKHTRVPISSKPRCFLTVRSSSWMTLQCQQHCHQVTQASTTGESAEGT